MRSEQIIRMMLQAGFDQCDPDTDCREPYWIAILSEIEAFADLVAAAEREACAKECEGVEGKPEYLSVAKLCAAAIRARGQA